MVVPILVALEVPEVAARAAALEMVPMEQQTQAVVAAVAAGPIHLALAAPA